ncbi:MAG: efflux RND transporter periplasmic adaptor subunit [Coraliomargarita sp.]|nr:efflux RND transporter periplasmic adaptor subunit [Coraliomargarita sp.]
MKRFIIILVVVAALGGGIAALFKVVPEAKNGSQTTLRTDKAAIRDLESVVSATGEVLPLLSSIVKSEISGRITVIHIDEGDTVERGAVLLELDRTSLEAKVKEVERSLEAERLRLEKSKRNFNRLDELFRKEFVGEQEYLDAQTDYELSELNLEIAKARLEDVQEDMAKTTITAPHDGIITKLDVVEGEVISGATSVSNGSELMTIAQMTELYMEANVNEVDVEKLYVGKPARLSFDALPGVVIDGTIDRIAVSARKDGNIRVFPIEIVFEVSDTRVRSGISATVDIPVDAVDGVVSALLSTVFFEEDKRFVYVQELAGWDKREVEVGINDMQHVEIKSGVSAGDRLALSRPSEFRNQEGGASASY